MQYEQLKAMKVEDMNRTEVIEAIRYQAHPSWFHSLLDWSTPRLKALLVYWRENDREGITGERNRSFLGDIHVGIEIHHTEIKLH